MPADNGADALRSARTLLDHLRTLQRRAGERIDAGHPEEAAPMLGECAAAWQKVSALVAVGCPGLTAHPAGAGRGPGEQLGIALRNLRDGLAIEDWSRVSDALAYDLDESVDRWLGLLDGAARPPRGAVSP